MNQCNYDIEFEIGMFFIKGFKTSYLCLLSLPEETLTDLQKLKLLNHTPEAIVEAFSEKQY